MKNLSAYLILLVIFISGCSVFPRHWDIKTDYFQISFNDKGFITSMENIARKLYQEFSPKDKPSPIMCIYDGKKGIYYKPVRAKFDKVKNELDLTFSNNSVGSQRFPRLGEKTTGRFSQKLET